ncbi:uncharacterized protein [Clytia hemisphaerica]|uniref:Uncharacterized protein n=1 Tax=Clytia hemisphaerica TaxID=252671 RepID=A0A7M5WJ57_9CNID
MSCGRQGCSWLTCTLCRTSHQSAQTLQKASRRSIEWPTQIHQPPNEQDGSTNITIDDAFDDVLQYMTTTARQCKRYHRSTCRQFTSDSDLLHLKRYHQNHKTANYKSNPLLKTEEVNVEVAPGTYAISAGAWGSDRQHTHVIHIKDNQTVDLNFGM